jgi:hypothetical protein
MNPATAQTPILTFLLMVFSLLWSP